MPLCISIWLYTVGRQFDNTSYACRAINIYIKQILWLKIMTKRIFCFLSGLHPPKYIWTGSGRDGRHDPTAGVAGHRPHAIARLPYDRGRFITLHAVALWRSQRIVRTRRLSYCTGMLSLNILVSIFIIYIFTNKIFVMIYRYVIHFICLPYIFININIICNK